MRLIGDRQQAVPLASGQDDDFHEADGVDVPERVLVVAVVAVTEEYAAPGDADPRAGTTAVAHVAEDDLQALPVRVDHVHDGQGI
jgi:hypothetical protein